MIKTRSGAALGAAVVVVAGWVLRAGNCPTSTSTRSRSPRRANGFEVLDSAPAHSLTLAGRYRFARYRLTFDLTDAAEGATRLRAQTCALLPGACGQVCRVLVVGTRAHAAATTHILRSVRRPSLAPA